MFISWRWAQADNNDFPPITIIHSSFVANKRAKSYGWEIHNGMAKVGKQVAIKM